MLSFKCHSSYSQAVVLVPKTVLTGFIWPNTRSSGTQFDFELGGMTFP